MIRLIMEIVLALGVIYGGAALIAKIGAWLAKPKEKDRDEFV
jgi:hypothetical protein